MGNVLGLINTCKCKRKHKTTRIIPSPSPMIQRRLRRRKCPNESPNCQGSFDIRSRDQLDRDIFLLWGVGGSDPIFDDEESCWTPSFARHCDCCIKTMPSMHRALQASRPANPPGAWIGVSDRAFTEPMLYRHAPCSTCKVEGLVDWLAHALIWREVDNGTIDEKEAMTLHENTTVSTVAPLHEPLRACILSCIPLSLHHFVVMGNSMPPGMVDRMCDGYGEEYVTAEAFRTWLNEIGFPQVPSHGQRAEEEGDGPKSTLTNMTRSEIHTHCK